jgi:hypothetical protein
MFDWLTHGAIPMGLVMFTITVVAFARRRIGFQQASKSLPELAKELGLEFSPPRYKKALGQINGMLSGYKVRVDPDELRQIIVRLNGQSGVDLRTYERNARPAPGLEPYRASNRRFNAFFKTRYATPEIAEKLEAEKLDALLDPFFGRWSRHVKAVAVTAEGVSCTLDFGSPPYIPGDAARVLLMACVALARAIEV